jgi:hypothetical protein
MEESMIQRHLKLTHRLAACGLAAAALLLALGTTGLVQHITGTPPIAAQGPRNPPTRSVRIFVLEIASDRIVRLTDEFWADRPAWSPDGRSIAFLSYQPTRADGRLLVCRP